MRWPPSEFWDATVADALDAYEGFAVYKGVKQHHDPSKYPSQADIADLKRKLIERHGHA